MGKKFAAVVVFAVAALYLITRIVIPDAASQSDGFAAYYTAARLALDGQAGSDFYDDSWFEARTVEFMHGAARDIYFANPPTTTFILLPLAGFSSDAARFIWTMFNLAALIGALALLTFATRLKLEQALLLSSLVFLSNPVAANFAHGQAYIMLLLLYALAMWAFTQRRAALAGASLALAFILKASGAPLWALMLARKERRLLVTSLVVLLVMTGASLPIFGLGTWEFYLTTEIPRFLRTPSNSVTAYQTVNSLFLHLFLFDPSWNPQPLLDAPLVGAFCTIVITLAALAWSLWLTRKMDTVHSFAVFAALSVVLAPIAEEYHFVLMAVPIFVLVADLAANPDPLYILATALAVVLVGAPINYKNPNLSQGVSALLAYPRLYGGCLIWGLSTLRGLRHALPARIPSAAANYGTLEPTK